MSSNKNVLIFIDWYYPAFKAGGPIKSVSNMITLLSTKLNFFIITGDRDLKDNDSFHDVTLDTWLKKTDYSIIYLSKSKRNKAFYKKLYSDVNPGTIYINGVFSYDFSIKPTRVFASSSAKLIVASRGMLGNNSLKIKPLKKKIFLFLMNLGNQYKNVVWHLNSSNELQELEKSVKSIYDKIIVPNLTSVEMGQKVDHKKVENELKLISVCRVLPIKNIHFVLSLLNEVSFKCQYSIIGPLEDGDYHQSCIKLSKELPENIEVEFLGAKKSNQIKIKLNESDVFISSSLNENYGHSIVEALGLAKPILISDQTPWRNLASLKAGADMPLKKDVFLDQLNKFAKMNNDEYQIYSQGAKSFFNQNMNPNLFKERYIKLLTS